MRFTIPDKPVPASRPRVTSRGTYTPTRYRRWLEAARWHLLSQKARPVEGPVVVDLSVEVDGITIEISAATETRPKRVRGDLDNYAKAALDACNGLAFADDSQVVELRARFLALDGGS